MNDERDVDRDKDKCIRKLIHDLANLTEEDNNALRLSAQKLLLGTRYDSPDDLLHEAIYRASTDSRHRPDHINAKIFIYQTMRSVASVDRRPGASLAAFGQRHTNFEDWSQEDQITSMGRDNLSPETLLILREELVEFERIRIAARENLGVDKDALAILDGRFQELSPKELRARLNLDEKKFKAADERARDAIRKAKRRLGG